jgi:putative iron-regulated protein
MKKIFACIAFVAIGGFGLFTSCNNDDNNGSSDSSNVTKAAVIANYANIVYANYSAALTDAEALKTSISTFTTTPTQANFDAAKAAWKASRESYGTTEAFRFANGPIDDANGPEPLINSWPLDEAYIDYVDGGETSANIINNPTLVPTISKEALSALNQDGDEVNVSTGYHAIEFLLWGQDLTAPSANLPGQRPYTDYVDGGTAQHQDRRRAYINACADLLIDNLSYVTNLWAPSGAYRATFLALPEDEALRNMYLGIATLSTAELAVERMQVALLSESQEDEHSCFSDNTHRDIRLNLQGIVNVYTGKYGNIEGASLADLVHQKGSDASHLAYHDTALALTDAQTKMNATGIPFDLDISGGEGSPEGIKINDTVSALQLLGANFIAGATSIGISVNVVTD